MTSEQIAGDITENSNEMKEEKLSRLRDMMTSTKDRKTSLRHSKSKENMKKFMTWDPNKSFHDIPLPSIPNESEGQGSQAVVMDIGMTDSELDFLMLAAAKQKHDSLNIHSKSEESIFNTSEDKLNQPDSNKD